MQVSCIYFYLMGRTDNISEIQWLLGCSFLLALGHNLKLLFKA